MFLNDLFIFLLVICQSMRGNKISASWVSPKWRERKSVSVNNGQYIRLVAYNCCAFEANMNKYSVEAEEILLFKLWVKQIRVMRIAGKTSSFNQKQQVQCSFHVTEVAQYFTATPILRGHSKNGRKISPSSGWKLSFPKAVWISRSSTV